MMYKLLGASLIIVGSGIVGYLMVASHKREAESLKEFVSILEYMSCLLQYQSTPLPEICRQINDQFPGNNGKVFLLLAQELDSQISPDVQRCMHAVLSNIKDVSKSTYDALMLLGNNLGHFGIDGQLRGIASVRADCEEKLKLITENQDVRLRTYQTVSLCAGAAIAIIFI